MKIKDKLKRSKPLDIKVAGFRASGISAGIKKNGKKDLALIVSDSMATVAGLFTVNKVKAAPVMLDMKRIGRAVSRGVIVNSGNANVSNGPFGMQVALRMTRAVEKEMGLKPGEILVASTGVIGVPLAPEKIEKGVPQLVRELRPDGIKDATQAIMTTDAFPKSSVSSAMIGGKKITIAGIAKGAGMICPDMATMLAFVMTDARIGTKALNAALRSANECSFNSIIVDNDMSTNDTVLVFANGEAKGAEIKAGSKEFKKFSDMLGKVLLDLAKLIVRDGEGATRLVQLDVKNAKNDDEAKRAARTIAESMLVKTAFHGGDPNWGRIMGALGRSGIAMKEEKIDITFNGVKVASRGIDTDMEKEAAAALKVEDILVTIDLRMGKGGARVYTSDLGYEYIKINSSYRT